MSASAVHSHEAAESRIAVEIDTSMYVAAGAGTGKTRNLVERVVALLARGVAPGELVIVTFTRAAAYELQTRIKEGLEKSTTDASGRTAEQTDNLKAALEHLDRAAIQTIDGFALSLLRDRPLAAGLPPIIEPLDDVQAGLEFDDRWQDWLRKSLDDPSFAAAVGVAVELGLDKPTSRLREIAEKFHARYNLVSPEAFPDSPASPRLSAQAVIDHGSRLSALREHCDDVADPMAAHLDIVVLPFIDRLKEAGPQSDDALYVLTTCPSFKTGAGQAPNWRKMDDGDPALEEVRNILKALKVIVAEELAAERRAALMPLLRNLAAFVTKYAAERRQQGTLEFKDMLVVACDVLKNNERERSYFRARFKHILIDEFQDTDPLQVELVKLLTEYSLDTGSLFVVGDAKQSIYRFRGADPTVATRVQNQLGEPVRLTHNFRSHPSILEWVNHVFGAWMGETKGAYQPDYVGLESGKPELWPNDGVARVSWLGGELDDDAEAVREAEAKAIASAIRDNVGRWKVTKPDREPDTAGYGDICVLIPTRTVIGALEREFIEQHVPFILEGQSLIFATQDVRDLLNCLAAIDDPTDQVAVVAALRSPAFGCSDVDLYDWHKAGGVFDFALTPLESAMAASKEVADAYSSIASFSLLASSVTANETIESFIRARRLREMALGSRQAEDRLRRLQFVAECARQVSDAGRTTLRAFIRWAEDRAESRERMVEAPLAASGGEAVRVMTVHAAKGLEFPVVIMAGLSGRPPNRFDAVLFDSGAVGTPRAEVRIESDDDEFKTDGYDELKKTEVEARKAEQVRLMYVAATRAKDHLVVSVFRKSDDKPSSAATIARLSAEKPGLWAELDTLSPSAGSVEEPRAEDVVIEPFEPKTWAIARDKDVSDAHETGLVVPSSLGHQTRGPLADQASKEPSESIESEPWRKGRAASELGRAVHAVLQEVDLANTLDLHALATRHAKAHASADSARVETLARAALGTTVMRRAREAASRGRCWREVPVSAQVAASDAFSSAATGTGSTAGVLVEGIIDLIFEDPSGGLVVIDYKTDAARDAVSLADAAAPYELQLGAYALAVESVTHRKVTEAWLVFADRAILGLDAEYRVPDLPGKVTRARTEILAG